jgi:glutathione S-transferase
MRLFTTPNSPYGRIVRVVLIETGLDQRVATEMVTVRDPNSALLALNPTGKVPTLLTESGEILSETRIILDYLDGLNEGPRLLAAPGDLQTRAREGQLFGCLDGVSTWMRELKRPLERRYPWLMEVEHARAARCLDHFEKDPSLLSDDVRLAQITLGCILSFIDTFLKDLDWREDRDSLATWYDVFETRPSMQATLPKPLET